MFRLEWSDDHLEVIATIEAAATGGGLFALAMPRGSGKTTIALAAVLWAALCGKVLFVVLIGATSKKSEELLANLKTIIETNELLAADFPAALYPIKKLNRLSQNSAGQTYQGIPTRVEWTTDRIVFPTIDGASSSGRVIATAGFKGSDLRGLQHARADGEIARPDLALIDDPQTRESAHSPNEVAKREKILSGDVLGMAGPGKKIAAVACVTVIAPNDLAERMLDREAHGEWKGKRTQLVYAFPEREDMWAHYQKLRAASLRGGGNGQEATEFYRANRAEMDRGAVVSWPARYDDDELSAVQNAMNLLGRDRRAFFAEYQNDPRGGSAEERDTELTIEAIFDAANERPRGEVPAGSEYLTAFIDVQQKMLFWAAVAWSESFGGQVLDYGTFPEQDRAFFTLRDAKRTLADANPTASLEAQLYAGLRGITREIIGRTWHRDDGAELRIARCLIDANWGESTSTVYQFARETEYGAIVVPSHGRYVGATSRPFAEYSLRKGERPGHNWRLRATEGQSSRHVIFDANYWKSFLVSRLLTPRGDPSALTLFGTRDDHELLSEHLLAEYRVKVSARGREVDEWKIKPSRFDNHWFDCLVGAAVAGSMEGAQMIGAETAVKRKRKIWTAAEIAARRGKR